MRVKHGTLHGTRNKFTTHPLTQNWGIQLAHHLVDVVVLLQRASVAWQNRKNMMILMGH